MCTVSRWPSSVGPAYHGVCADGVTTLSPFSALRGMNFTSLMSSSGRNSSNCSRISLKRASLQPTRSILLIATTRCGMRSSEAIAVWRRLCSITPRRASTSTMERFALLAPVTMLRVYCTWPGVSAMMNARRGEVAVGDVDRDALLALGAEAVGEVGEVDLTAAGDVGGALEGFNLVLHERLR